jgi:hypothetical protein
MREHNGNWHILVLNLPVKGDGFSLGSGLWIKPINEKLNVFNMAALGAIGFREWAVLEPMTGGLHSEIVSAKDGDTIPGYDALNRAWLALALLCLRGYTLQMGIACSSFSWDEAEGLRKGVSSKFIKKEIVGDDGAETPQEKNEFIGGLLDYHIKIIRTKNPKTELSLTDANWVAEHFEKFNRLAAESAAFRFSLEAAVDWRFSKDVRAAISRVWAGIESVLELKMETVYRLSTIVASLFAPRGPERIQKFKATKKLYDTRSKAVHGGTLKPETLADALDESFSILSGLLLLCIEKGKVLDNDDFEKALFS